MDIIKLICMLLLVQVILQTEHIYPLLAYIDRWTPAFPQVRSPTLLAMKINTTAWQASPAVAATSTTVRCVLTSAPQVWNPDIWNEMYKMILL